MTASRHVACLAVIPACAEWLCPSHSKVFEGALSQTIDRQVPCKRSCCAGDGDVDNIHRAFVPFGPYPTPSPPSAADLPRPQIEVPRAEKGAQPNGEMGTRILHATPPMARAHTPPPAGEHVDAHGAGWHRRRSCQVSVMRAGGVAIVQLCHVTLLQPRRRSTAQPCAGQARTCNLLPWGQQRPSLRLVRQLA